MLPVHADAANLQGIGGRCLPSTRLTTSRNGGIGPRRGTRRDAAAALEPLVSSGYSSFGLMLAGALQMSRSDRPLHKHGYPSS